MFDLLHKVVRSLERSLHNLRNLLGGGRTITNKVTDDKLYDTLLEIKEEIRNLMRHLSELDNYLRNVATKGELIRFRKEILLKLEEERKWIKDLESKLRGITERFYRIEERFSDLEEKLPEIVHSLDSLAKKEDLERKIDQVMDKISPVLYKKEIGDLKGRVKNIEGKPIRLNEKLDKVVDSITNDRFEKRISKFGNGESIASWKLDKEAIDLGKKKRRGKTHPRTGTESVVEDKERREQIIRVQNPSIELELDGPGVFLVIPSQRIPKEYMKNGVTKRELIYKITINDKEEESKSAIVIEEEDHYKVDEVRIPIKERISKLSIRYPPELKGKSYLYEHPDKFNFLYVFTVVDDRTGKMWFISSMDGHMNPLPKRKIWILLKSGFELDEIPILIKEESWIWGEYQLMLVDLKEVDELKVRELGEDTLISIPCASDFQISSESYVRDDLSDVSPILTGNKITIKSPEWNEVKWEVCVRLKGKKGYKQIMGTGLMEPLSSHPRSCRPIVVSSK